MAYKRTTPQPVIEGGTGASTLTSHGVLLGQGTSAITGTAVGSNGQLLIGSSAADPAFATLTSTGTTLTYTTGAHALNIDINAPVTVPNGGTGAITLTDHGVLLGHGTSAIAATTAGTDGQVLIGASGANPAFSTLTSTGGTIDFTAGAHTLNIEIDTPVSIANGGTGVDSFSQANGLLYYDQDDGKLKTIAPGNATDLLFSNGALFPPSFQLNTFFVNVVQPLTFTADDTYTPSTTLVAAIIECVGGGGGGGGCAQGTNAGHIAAAGGGGGGAYSWTIAYPTTTQVITIGLGGAGGTAGNNPGTNGGATSVGALISAPGGSGGSGSPVAINLGVINGGGAGGVAGSSGELQHSAGSPGGTGFGFNVGTTNRWAQGGVGGSSAWGGGALAPIVGITSAAQAGIAAGNYGGGGSGACLTGIQAAQAGGNGSNGFVRITEIVANTP